MMRPTLTVVLVAFLGDASLQGEEKARPAADDSLLPAKLLKVASGELAKARESYQSLADGGEAPGGVWKGAATSRAGWGRGRRMGRAEPRIGALCLLFCRGRRSP